MNYQEILAGTDAGTYFGPPSPQMELPPAPVDNPANYMQAMRERFARKREQETDYERLMREAFDPVPAGQEDSMSQVVGYCPSLKKQRAGWGRPFLDEFDTIEGELTPPHILRQIGFSGMITKRSGEPLGGRYFMVYLDLFLRHRREFYDTHPGALEADREIYAGRIQRVARSWFKRRALASIDIQSWNARTSYLLGGLVWDMVDAVV